MNALVYFLMPRKTFFRRRRQTGTQGKNRPTTWGPARAKDYPNMPKTPKKTTAFKHNQLHKCLTGIKGFDEITEGGLPKNRTTLFSGSTGTGKTLLGIDFLITARWQNGNPGQRDAVRIFQHQPTNDLEEPCPRR
jgi:hypothetical protein